MFSALRGKKVLVTGGCGFIGSHMVERLLAEDVTEVIVIDSLEFGVANHLPQDPRIHLIQSLLEDPNLSDKLKTFGACDYLIHLAARKHNQSKHSPDDIIASNILGTQRIISYAAELGIKKMVFSSSLYAYGRMSGEPMREDELPQPATLYGISKLTGERLFAWGFKQYGIPFNVVRYFFVYGPKQYPGLGYKSVIVKNFNRILQGEPAIIRGDGQQTLDYFFVTDAVEGTLLALLSEHTSETFNLGSGKGVTVDELTNTMYTVSGANRKVTYEPQDETHGSRRVGNIEKAHTLLKFSPHVTLLDGLTNTFAWVREQKSRN